MRKPLILSLSALVLLAGGWLGYAGIRARGNLVTLDVRNADIRSVVRKMEWQTWETIYVHRNVEGKVTMKVHKMPLEQALGIASEQVSSRWTAMYPLYSSGKSLKALRAAVQGETDSTPKGWSALSDRPFVPRGSFADNVRSQNELISLKIEDKDLEVATLALARFARARVIPEDGTQGRVNLTLTKVTMPNAVSQLASQVNRDWTQFYVLQSGRRMETARREDSGTSDGQNVFTNRAAPGDWFNRTPSAEEAERRQKQFEAQLETMTPEEKERALEQRKRWEEMRNLTPEQRQQRFAEMAQSPEFQQRMQSRMLQRIKDTTPEQRAERDQRIALRRQQRGQR